MSKVDENAADCGRMVLSAKNGEWNTVYEILRAKPNLINTTPEGRTWTALHQAVYRRNQKAVVTLLSYPSCDTLVKTKPNRSDPVGGKTPSQIAQNNKTWDIKAIIDDYEAKQRHKRFSKDIPYLITTTNGDQIIIKREGLPPTLSTLYNYKSSFRSTHPAQNDMPPYRNFHEVLEQNPTFEHQGSWLHARDKIAVSLHAFAQDAGQHLSEKTTEDEFYDEIIRMYTRNNMHGAANRALNREGKADYIPTGDDLALGPYVLMLDMLLFFWNRLNQHSGVAYKGVGMWRNDALLKYVPGYKFIWLQFVSATKVEQVAMKFGRSHKKGNHFVIFVIDNSSAPSQWRPRDISGHSSYASDFEVLYPAGTEFEVMQTGYTEDVAGHYTTIKLRLA